MEILHFCVEKLRSHDVDKFELCFERSSSVGVEINDGKLDHLSRATDQGLALRLLKDQKMGFSYTFDLSREAVETAVKRALEIAELMPSDPLNDLCATGQDHGYSGVLYSEIDQFDQQGLAVPLEKKIEIAQSIETAAKKFDPRIKRVRKAAFDEIQGETVMVDSHGELIRSQATIFASELMCVAEEGTDAEMGYDSRYSTFLDQLEYSEVALQAAKNALELMHAGTCPTMTCSAVLKNSVVAQLISFLSSSFSAENIDKNFSLLVGKKNEKLFSEKLTLIDDGLLPNGTATAPFDGEGLPSQTTKLLDQGMVMNFLYDSYYARKHKTKSTSNCRRGSLKSPPGIGPTNLYLRKGSPTFDKLVQSVSKGIYITDVMGLHTANPVTGEFSFGASGVLIEGGKLTKPVKGFAIAGNLVDLLQHVSEVGSDLRFWGSVGAPSILISKLAISGS